MLTHAQAYYFSIDTQSNLLQNDINALFNHGNSWHLFFKILSVHTCIFPGTDTPTYYINNMEISKKTETKDLGMTFNSNLHWDQHYKNITSRAYKCLYLLKRTFNTHATASKKLLYISLVRSQLIYCSQLWWLYLLKDIITLERIQRRATKFIQNHYQSIYRFRLVKLHLLPLLYLFELYDIIFAIKSLKNLTISFSIYNFIQFHLSSSRLSHANKLIQHRSTNLAMHHFFFNRVPRLWNVLPIIDMSLPTTTLISRLKT